MEELQAAHQTLEGTILGVTQEQAHWHPPGIAHPVGATYAHVILSEDATINGMFKGQAPLFAGGWVGQTGVSEPPPMLNPQKPGFPDWSEWGRRVRVDLEKLRQYAKAVYAASEAYLLSLSDRFESPNRPFRFRPWAIHFSVCADQRNYGKCPYPLRGNILSEGIAVGARISFLIQARFD